MKFLLALGALLTHLVTGGQMWPFPGPGSHASHVPAPVTQIITGGSSTNLGASATVYAFPASASAGAPSSTEANFQAIMLAGTVSNLHVVLSGTTAGTADFTLRYCTIAGGCNNSALTCQVGIAGSTCVDNTHNFHVDDGDYLTMKIATGVGASAVTQGWTWKWVGDVGDESMLIGRYNASATSGTVCGALVGVGAAVAGTCSATSWRILVPEAFTATKLFARASTDIGADSATRVFTINRNGSSDSALQATLTGVATTGLYGSDISGSVPIAAGDTISMQDAISNTPAAGFYSYTVALTNVNQRFMSGTCNAASGSTSAVNYARPAGDQSWNATETLRSEPALGFTLTGIGAQVFAAPTGATKDWVVAFRDDTADTLTCQILDTAKTCRTTGTSTVAADSLVAWGSTPHNTPSGQTDYCFAYTGSGT